MTALGLNIAMSGGGSGLLAPTIPVALDFQNKRFWLGSASTKVLTEVAGFSYARPGYNLIPYSTDPSNAGWLASNVVKTPGLTDRFGGSTAVRVTGDGNSAPHFLAVGNNLVPFVAGVTYNLAIDFYAETQSFVQITGTSGVFGTGQYANFDLSTGLVTASAGVVGTPVLEDLGDGWFRASMAVTATTSATGTGLAVGIIASGTATRLLPNTLTTSFLVARPQAEPGTVANVYQPTGATALTFAPIATADGLIDDVATNQVTIFNANPTNLTGVAVAVGAGVLSLVSDAAELAAADLSDECTLGNVFKLDNSASGANSEVTIAKASANLNNHAAVIWARGTGQFAFGLNQGGTLGIDPWLNPTSGYSRIVKLGQPATSTVTLRVRAAPGAVVYFILPGLYERPTAPAVDVVTLGASASGVVGQVQGVISFPANEPRLTSRGLLVEEARTEATLNNVWDGWEIGESITSDVQGGSVANGALFGWASGLTVTLVGKGVDKGLPYLDLRVQGTPATSPHFRAQFTVSANAPAAVAGEAWVGTCDLALVSGSLTNVTGTALRIDELNSSNAVLATRAGGSIVPTSTLTRFSHQFSLSDAACAKARSYLAFSGSGAAVDYTIRIAAPNCHKGTGVTSRILTGQVPLTRAADPSWITGLGAYLSAPFTLSVEADFTPLNAVSQRLVGVSDGTANTVAQVAKSAGNQLVSQTVVGGTITTPAGPTATAAGVYKAAMRVRPGDVKHAVNAALQTGLTASAPTGLHTLDIGHLRSGSHINGAIRRIQIAKNTTDAQLKRFTTSGYAIPEPPENSSLLRLLLLGF